MYALLCCYLETGPVSFASAQARQHDLIVPLQFASPRLRIHAGAVEGERPAILPTLPDIPGLPSTWYLAQWQRDRYLGPLDVRPVEPTSHWRATTPDADAFLDIRRDGTGTIYGLFERDGALTGSGGADLFLATDTTDAGNDLSRPTFVSIGYRITAASVAYFTDDAVRTGAVQSSAFIGMTLTFGGTRDPDHRAVFIQIPLFVSRNLGSKPIVICFLNQSIPNLLYIVGAKQARSMIDHGYTMSAYRIDGILETMFSRPYACGASMQTWPGAEQDLASWHFASLYVGVETQNRDLRGTAANHRPQGHAQAGLDIKQLSVFQP